MTTQHQQDRARRSDLMDELRNLLEGRERLLLRIADMTPPFLKERDRRVFLRARLWLRIQRISATAQAVATSNFIVENRVP